MGAGDRDYSGTPLPKKLGVRESSRVLVVGAPDGFQERLVPMPRGAELVKRTSAGLDVVLVFVRRRADLLRRFRRLAAALVPDGRLWIAWPKKTARLPTDLDFDTVQQIGLDGGLVDNKSASITETFQGLQFVYRVKDRPGR